MSNILIAFFAYIIDKIFGEFKFIKHPIIIIGELITKFENYYYKDSIFRGFLLVIFILSFIGFITFLLTLLTSWNIILTSILASMFLAHNMLYTAVKELLTSNDKRASISMLVSRDTNEMGESDIYKAGIETYAENLSDGVIAPLFYLLLFGLPGIILYKTINTLDSMVGYKNDRYINYGKTSAILDDIINFIPSRITAVLIMLIFRQKNIFAFYKDGKRHESPNAGHPITAMALYLGVKLGGDTSYFGKIKHKAYFGNGRKNIQADDLKKALQIRTKIDFIILVSLFLLYLIIIFI
ncbi:MAG: cobalamin biosynthesis protein CobD [Sulfurimonas sp.]|nr:MAG: cobalamin biosynthesis protein CobD [Sulfurimonas sp.]